MSFKEALKSSYFLVGVVKAGRQVGTDLRRLKWRLQRDRAIAAYLGEHATRKLHVGCGRNVLPGWLNTDAFVTQPGAVYLDATTSFPLETASFDYVFSEHVIEHLTYPQGGVMLKECHRVLKPGGRIRIATPNLLNIIGLATERPTDAQQRYIKWAVDENMRDIGVYKPAFVINNFFWDFGHYFVYDPESLRFALETAGFRNVTSREPGRSDDPELAGIETHGKVIGEEWNAFETMVLEAER